MTRWVRRRWRRLVTWTLVAALLLGALTLGAAQPWTANQFGYALPGHDGLPSTIYESGQTYSSAQVCAGADWCAADAAIQDIPRCYTEADLVNMKAWPLEQFDSMFTLFGARRALLRPTPSSGFSSGQIIIADGSGCYVWYGLQGSPCGGMSSAPRDSGQGRRFGSLPAAFGARSLGGAAARSC